MSGTVHGHKWSHLLLLSILCVSGVSCENVKVTKITEDLWA